MSNEDAIAFYERFGFRVVERKENYYKRIEPADAFVLQKNLKPSPETTADSASTETSDVVVTSVSHEQSETVHATTE